VRFPAVIEPVFIICFYLHPSDLFIYIFCTKPTEKQPFSNDSGAGNPIPEEIFSGGDATFTEDITASAEQVKHVIEDSKKLLLPNPEECVGAWGLIDADQGLEILIKIKRGKMIS